MQTAAQQIRQCDLTTKSNVHSVIYVTFICYRLKTHVNETIMPLCKPLGHVHTVEHVVRTSLEQATNNLQQA